MKLVHVSDTHLGKRPKQTRAGIINHETRPLEDDFYHAWIKVVDDILDMKNKPDIILHCGDFFDSPSGLDPSSPPEYARRITAETFKRLYEAKIPFFIIDGNHGRYIQYRSSTLAEYPSAFDNIHLFTYYDLWEAVKTQMPLFKDISDLNLRIIAHPAIEERLLSTLGIYSLYDKWIRIQNNTIHKDMINIGMAHGMISNSSLHPAFLGGKYDYVALGDDHKMHKVTDYAWYSGSTQMWSFNEYGDERGYLVVEVGDGDKGGQPKVTHKKVESLRKVISDQIQISAKDTNSTVIDRIRDLLDLHGLAGKYNYTNAAKVRISLIGVKTYGASFNISEIESYLRRLMLEGDNYNIVEFVLDSPSYSEFTGVEQIPVDSNIEYLLEDPGREFGEYINSTRVEDIKKQNLDPTLLAKIFASVLFKEETVLSEDS